jgi:type II secretory pathway pseudopilin PulG
MNKGFTIIEVLISLAVLIIAISILSSTVIGSTRHDRNSGMKTQAVELLNYIGRYALEGSTVVVPAAPATTKTINYGALASTLPGIQSQSGFGDLANYKAVVESKGTVSLAGAVANRYDIKVCWKDKAGEACIGSTTMGPIVAGKSVVN